MSVAEIKKTILEKVDTFSEKQLIELKEYVDRINNPTVKEYDLLRHAENIMSERKEVIKKLAQ